MTSLKVTQKTIEKFKEEVDRLLAETKTYKKEGQYTKLNNTDQELNFQFFQAREMIKNALNILI